MAFWLMKSEPDTFSIDDLMARPKQTEPWDGVRNYQARNFMRDGMEIGDHAFFYHSSCEEPGIVGIMRVVARAHPDLSQWNPKSPYYDPKSTRQEPRWFAVDMRFERRLSRNITLTELRKHEKELRGFRLLMTGSRLSVIPVAAEHWDYILALENA
jgi:predicted RNA-binding protein with PUA-like domain